MEELPSVCQQGNTKGFQYGALKWVKASEGDVPKDTVEGGIVGEETIYIGRVNYGSDRWIPGIIVKHSRGCGYIDSNYMRRSDKYEALVCPYAAESLEWVETTGRNIPPNAVVGGCEEPGRPYYIGRTYLGKGKKKDLVPGKVDLKAGGLVTCKSVGTNKVATFDKFEILVSKGEAQLVEEISRQVFRDVRYDTNPDAIKHTIIPNVALANVPVENESSLPQKIKTTTSLFITETFSWSNERPQNMTTAIPTEYQCGVPYISFGNKEVCVTPDGVLPKQMQNPNHIFDCYKTSHNNILEGIDESQKVIPNVRTGMSMKYYLYKYNNDFLCTYQTSKHHFIVIR